MNVRVENMSEIPQVKQDNSTVLQGGTFQPSAITFSEYIKRIAENIENEGINRSKLIWLHNVFFHCPWDVRTMIPNRAYDSVTVGIQRYSVSFKLRMTKYSHTNILVELHREFTQYLPSDETYFLRIFFEMENSLCPAQFADLPFFLSNVLWDFSTCGLCDSSQTEGSTIVQCRIWMYESQPLQNKTSEIAENSLRKSLQEYQSSALTTFEDMAYLMNCKEMNGLFSGRHGEVFVNEKLLLIERTCLFSNILARRKRCAENGQNVHKLKPIDTILGYIYNGIIYNIEKAECLHLFKMSYQYGLPYLQDECSEFLFYNMSDDWDFLVDVIFLTKTFERSNILDWALRNFLRFKERVLECHRWKMLFAYAPLEMRFVLTVLKRRELLYLDGSGMYGQQQDNHPSLYA